MPVSCSFLSSLCSQPIRANVRRTGRIFPEHAERSFLDPEYCFVAVRRIPRTRFAKQKFVQLRTNYIGPGSTNILIYVREANVRTLKNGLKPTKLVSSHLQWTQVYILPNPSVHRYLSSSYLQQTQVSKSYLQQTQISSPSLQQTHIYRVPTAVYIIYNREFLCPSQPDVEFQLPENPNIESLPPANPGVEVPSPANPHRVVHGHGF